MDFTLTEEQQMLRDTAREFFARECSIDFVRSAWSKPTLAVGLWKPHLPGWIDLAAADLPGAWNERIKKDLGLEVPAAARGCLQDIHWSLGSIGYFPTYTLGTLYSAQFWDAILVDLPELPHSIARGEFAGLLHWLREKIHRRGRQLPAEALCLELTGKPLDHQSFMDHLRAKLGDIYGLTGS